MAQWLDALQEAGVPCGAIQTYDQVFSDPQLQARGYIWKAPHPVLGDVEQLGSPMRLSRTPVREDEAGPLLGEHSAQVLAEIGLGEAEIEQLVESGVTARA
jgi:formyl-CoA transferase